MIESFQIQYLTQTALHNSKNLNNREHLRECSTLERDLRLHCAPTRIKCARLLFVDRQSKKAAFTVALKFRTAHRAAQKTQPYALFEITFRFGSGVPMNGRGTIYS